MRHKGLVGTARRLAQGAVIATVCALLPARLGAQEARSGIWYELTIGGAAGRLTCDICQASWDAGPAVTATMGGYAGRKLRVGLEFSRWSHKDAAVREQTYGLGVVGHLSPNPARGLYLVGGIGWTGYRAGDFSYDAPRLTIGAGWDLPAFGRYVVGNVVTFDAASFAPLKNGNATVINSVGLSAIRGAVQLRRR